MDNIMPFESIEKAGNFTIQSAPANFSLREVTKLPVSIEEKARFGAVLKDLPIAAAGNNLYVVKFPKGVSHTLTKFKKGGYSTMVHDPETGDLLAHASFHKLGGQAALVGIFAAMSIATSQYYLTEINNELKIITHKIDQILDFLYGDKKAELLGEIAFTKYAYENYSSIMQFDEQRVATISSLQQARKIAMKDIEFYLSDLETIISTESRAATEITKTCERSKHISESIDLSIQLYVTSALLEVLYSQNMEDSYTNFLEKEISYYIEKCDKRELASFTTLKTKVDSFKNPAIGQGIDKTELSVPINTRIDDIFGGEAAKRQKAILEVLHSITDSAEYVVSLDGDVYYKRIA